MLDRIKDFYDYVFFMMYRLNTWHNEDSKRKKIPYYCDVLFSSIWQMGILTALNFFPLRIFLLLVLGLSEYVRIDFFLFIDLFIAYMCLYYIYQYKKRYKIVIKKYTGKKLPIIPVVLYGILSYGIAITTFILIT